MRPWAEIEPDAIQWAKEYYAAKERKELKEIYGKGSRLLSAAELRNRLVKRFVKVSLDQWSRDLSAGRPVSVRRISEGGR